jgi:hypothetical protein
MGKAKVALERWAKYQAKRISRMPFVPKTAWKSIDYWYVTTLRIIKIFIPWP